MAARKRFDHKAFVKALTNKETSIRVSGGRIVVPGHAKTEILRVIRLLTKAVFSGTARVGGKQESKQEEQVRGASCRPASSRLGRIVSCVFIYSLPANCQYVQTRLFSPGQFLAVAYLPHRLSHLPPIQGTA